MTFHQQLLEWYQQNKRDLPWRNTQNAYVIWLSEIILQQTRVEQGLPYFNRFLAAFPTVSDFAAAPEDEVLRLWQGLGYYSRGRNMLVTAKQVENHFGGKFPTSYDQLIKLKGIGEYTAAAIASFSSGEAKAVLDGNVFRVLARYYGIDEPINGTKGKKIFQQLANELLNPTNPGMHNQAMMELGAIICKPKKPACGICPVRYGCYAFKHNATGNFPIKLAKTKVRERFFNYLVIGNSDDSFLIHKRGTNDIWANLYEFPLIETAEAVEPHDLLLLPEMKNFVEQNFTIKKIYPIRKHVLTHQRLYVRFVEIGPVCTQLPSDYFFTEVKNLKNLALPQIIFIFLTNFLN